MDDVLTVEELATILQLNPQTVYRQVRQRQIPAVCIGRTVRFLREDIEPYIQAYLERKRRSAARRRGSA